MSTRKRKASPERLARYVDYYDKKSNLSFIEGLLQLLSFMDDFALEL